MSLHDCGSGVEAYELRRVDGGDFDGWIVMGCPGCGWEWLQGCEAFVLSAVEAEDDA